MPKYIDAQDSKDRVWMIPKFSRVDVRSGRPTNPLIGFQLRTADAISILSYSDTGPKNAKATVASARSLFGWTL